MTEMNKRSSAPAIVFAFLLVVGAIVAIAGSVVWAQRYWL